MKQKVIEAAWLDYRAKVVPPGASPVQVSETRKAFYSGAGTLIESLMKVLGPGGDATESDLLIMNGIQEELDEFIRDVLKTGESNGKT